MKFFPKLLMLISLSGISTVTMADITGQVDVTATVATACNISGPKSGGSSTKLGALNFGTLAPVWPADVMGTSKGIQGIVLDLTCSLGAVVNLTINAGAHSTAGGSNRFLKIESVSEADADPTSGLIGYRIYRDKAQANEYGIDPTLIALDENGKATVSIYGKIESNPKQSKRKGEYKDSLQVTIAF